MSYKSGADYPPNLDISPTFIAAAGHRRKSHIPHHLNARIHRKTFSNDRSLSLGEDHKIEQEQELMDNCDEALWTFSTTYDKPKKEKLYLKRGALTPGNTRKSYNDSHHSFYTEKPHHKYKEWRLVPHKSEIELESCSGDSSETSLSYISPYSFLTPLPRYPSFKYESSSTSRHCRKSSAGSSHLVEAQEGVYCGSDDYHIQSQLAKMMFRLTVDDHQSLISNMAVSVSAKKDYIHNSTEHRSGS